VWRRKEDGGLRATTRGFDLPCFLDTLCTHRHTPLLDPDPTSTHWAGQGEDCAIHASRDQRSCRSEGV
jgi:hypothetical protein